MRFTPRSSTLPPRVDGNRKVAPPTVLFLISLSFVLGMHTELFVVEKDVSLDCDCNQKTNVYETGRAEEGVSEKGEEPAAAASPEKILRSHKTKEVVTSCEPLSPEQEKALQTEIEHYERGRKFQNKISQVIEGEVVAQHSGILEYLVENVLQQSYTTLLDLGAAPGIMLQAVDRHYEKQNWEVARAVGVELVPGWVSFAKQYERFQQRKIEFYEGDVTNFTLPTHEHNTFDFVMLNDVMEHVIPERFDCFTAQLQGVTHTDSIVYMHNPTPQTQLIDGAKNDDTRQFMENVVAPHVIIGKMARAGFELVTYEQDVETKCVVKPFKGKTPLQVVRSKCTVDGWSKYSHFVFHRVRPRHKGAIADA